MITYESNNLAETEAVAAEIAKELKNGGFLALYGGMGAGKTSFVRGLVQELCPECLDLVHSPTFAIVNEYRGNEISVFHFDLYRLTDEDDLYSTGFYDYVEQGALVITEWSE
ncbi:MAG: tRNA (adenosine(37)-N6)-threonylcarbamoyltransferase complex ATPase subunit type 1 TsaE, partial [Clostridia bacterium]|nr:tRNA (adenosine(37)-N6)-threonylcarbamoyltransferase complex ATPase subunit type 1 TsaE [Clostridia bacterium]